MYFAYHNYFNTYAMTKVNTLTVVEQKEVEFYEDELAAVRTADGDVFVSLRHMCEALGIDSQGQRQRIQRHTVLAKGLMVCKLHTIKGLRNAYVLRVDLMPLWLSGIRSSSVKEAVRPKIERFQTEAAKILWQAFENRSLSTDSTFSELLQHADHEAVEAYEMLQAMVKLARSHVILSSKVQDHESRLSLVEAKMGDKRQQITTEQAAQVQAAIKSIATVLTKQSGRNQYGSVWNEFYRRFGIPDYRSLPLQKFDEAINYLRDWWQSLTDSSDIPF